MIVYTLFCVNLYLVPCSHTFTFKLISFICHIDMCIYVCMFVFIHIYTVKSRLSERQLFETTGLFEDNGQSRLFSLLSIAIKLPIIRISIIRKNQFFEVIRRSR